MDAEKYFQPGRDIKTMPRQSGFFKVNHGCLMACYATESIKMD